MNPRLIAHRFGLMLLVLAAAMGLAAAAQALGGLGGGRRGGPAVWGLAAGAAAAGVVGASAWAAGRARRTDRFNRRDALLLVAAVWLLGAAASALPFYVWTHLAAHDVAAASDLPGDAARHVFFGFAACYFEAMSGLSTTGATVLGAAPFDIESLPRGLLLWRALTHWLGGLGIVVLFVALMSDGGTRGRRMFQAEAAGTSATGARPRVRESARVVWLIYLVLTLVQIGMLRWAGMPWFDGVCHSLSDMATGGLSTRNASVGAYYATPSIEVVILVFMVLAGVNFTLYDRLLRGEFKVVWRDPELRAYLAILAGASLLIAALIWGVPAVTTAGAPVDPTAPAALRDAAFQVAAIQTGTGFGTVDYEGWPFGARAVLVTLMFIGGMSGSTTGGLKVVRVLVLLKIAWAELERAFRPQVVHPVQLGGKVLDSGEARSVLVYLLLIVLVFAAGSVGLVLLEPAGTLGYPSAASATVSTLMNIGPGVGAVGPTEHYGFFGGPSLVVLSLLMALGRLELFALLALLRPRFWTGR